MLDVDGDGQITYDELVTTIQEAYAARCAGGLQAAGDACVLARWTCPEESLSGWCTAGVSMFGGRLRCSLALAQECGEDGQEHTGQRHP